MYKTYRNGKVRVSPLIGAEPVKEMRCAGCKMVIGKDEKRFQPKSIEMKRNAFCQNCAEKKDADNRSRISRLRAAEEAKVKTPPVMSENIRKWLNA